MFQEDALKHSQPSVKCLLDFSFSLFLSVLL